MINIKKLEIYREFQKNVMALVQSEAIMCNFKEYTVSIRYQRTEVKIFVQGYTAILKVFITGRVVIQITLSQTEDGGDILLDEVDKDFVAGGCTVADLVCKYLYEVFNVALDLRKRRPRDLIEQHNKRMEAVKETLDTIGNQPHRILTSDEINSVLEDIRISITDDRYLSSFDEKF